MISSNYKGQLLKEAKKLDTLIGNSSEFEKVILEITDGQSDKAILELIKNLGIITKKNIIPDMNLKQEKIVEILYKYLGSVKVEEVYNTLIQTSNITLDELLKQLDELVGLENVKQQVRDLIDYNKIQRLRMNIGLKKSNKTLHMAFLGNPGTAKTTVARVLSEECIKPSDC